MIRVMRGMVMGLVSLGGSELSLRPALRICDFVRVRLRSPLACIHSGHTSLLTAKSSEVNKVTPSTHGPAGRPGEPHTVQYSQITLNSRKFTRTRPLKSYEFSSPISIDVL